MINLIIKNENNKEEFTVSLSGDSTFEELKEVVRTAIPSYAEEEEPTEVEVEVKVEVNKKNIITLYWNSVDLNNKLKLKSVLVDKDNCANTCTQLFNNILNKELEKLNNIEVTKYGHLFFKRSDLKIDFQKTIRVPDDNKSYPLPPSLGSYKLIQEEDKFTLPMYQKEAMWMKFSGSQVALKIGIGDVNAITGEKWQEGVLSQSPQNYVIAPQQHWLDGIKVNNIESKESTTNGMINGCYATGQIGPVADKVIENLVRQFVALPIDSKATIEQQLIEQGKIDKVVGGLRFEAFTLNNNNFKCYSKQKKNMYDPDTLDLDEIKLSLGEELTFFSNKFKEQTGDVTYTLNDIGIQDGDTVNMSYYESEFQIFVKTLTNKIITLNGNYKMTILDLMLQIQKQENIYVNEQRLIFGGQQLKHELTLKQYNILPDSTIHLVLRLRGGGGNDPRFNPAMGMGTGGLISQKIYLDTHKLSVYNLEGYESCKVNLVNAYIYSYLNKNKANFVVPTTAISAKTYIQYGYPWYELYDKYDKALTDNSESMFSKIESISKFKNEVLFDAEECCICMERVANMEYDPCGHQICSECLIQVTKDADEENKAAGVKLDPLKKSSVYQCHLCRSEIKSEQVKILSGQVSLEEFDEPLKVDNNMLIIHIK